MAARPWIAALRSNTLEPERREKAPHRSDEVVRNFFSWFRAPSKRVGWRAWVEARAIIFQSKRLTRLSDESLAALVLAQRPRLLSRGFEGPALRTAAAGIRELTGRTLGMRHHPVQVIGGLALLRGNIVEMATGEGKTITSLIPAILAALAGVPVHIVTVNEYLAQRDCRQLAKVIKPLGLRVGLVTEETEHRERPDIYSADIVFTTNKDVAFDYLRDRIAQGRHRSALSALGHRALASHWRDSRRNIARGLGFAIVDEVDSILIDEAQTPLIITAETDSANELVIARAFLDLAASLEEGRHYRLDRQRRSIMLLDDADPVIDGLVPPSRELVPKLARQEKLVQALSALHLYHRDEHYIVTEKGVAIVDEFTGRVMADRQWQKGLHQLIEAKEEIEQSSDRETLAQITYQTFFSRYLWFGGMTGTAREVARELGNAHDLPVLRLPTHRPLRRREKATRLYGSEDRKWRAVVDETLRQTAKGRPVLIGTRSVRASEVIAARFEKARRSPVILNAKQDAEEAGIVARAGEFGRITIATNIAGRGTDIPVPEDSLRRGGLHVILTEFHESARIDRQFIGRTGRQGQTGTAISIVSLEDRLFTDTLPRLTTFFRLLTFGQKGRLPGWVGEFLRILAQSKREKLGKRRRAQTVRRAHRLARALGFRPDNI